MIKKKKKSKPKKKRRLLISFFAHDKVYENGTLRTINGRQDANAWKNDPAKRLGTIGRSKNAHLPMLAGSKNYKNFAFVRELNVFSLFVNVVTDYDKTAKAISTTSTTLTLYSTPKKSAREWVMMSRDITLLEADGVTPLKFNPSAIAQVGDRLYLIDYDTRRIIIIGTNELNGLPDGASITPNVAPFDLSTIPELEVDLTYKARGVAIGAAPRRAGDGTVTNCLFPLFNMPYDAAAEEYEPSVLVRLAIDGDELVYEAHTLMGLNTPELVIFRLSTKERHVVVPAIGGKQQAGTTNEAESNIMSVPAFGDWSGGARILISGVDNESGVTSYDIRGIAASPRAENNGRVIIATGYYNTLGYTGLKWRLYETTIALLLNAQGQDLESAVTLGILKELDAGETLSPPLKDGEDPYGVYFFNVLYEASGAGCSHKKDRYWIFLGTELLVTEVYAYSSPTRPAPDDPLGKSYKLFPLGYGVNDIGGDNVQSAELIIELIHQVIAGVANKRSVTALPIPRAAVEEDSDSEAEGKNG
jgi:hypothetical protein